MFLLAKNTGFPKRKVKGETDFCEQGCLLVDEIRVPYPDCSIHGGKVK